MLSREKLKSLLRSGYVMGLREKLKFLLKNRYFVIGLSIVLPPTLLGLFGPLFISPDAIAVGSAVLGAPPSWAHILGTDAFGRDVFALLTYSISNSYAIGLLAGGFAILLGLTVGLLSGYKGGITDDVLANITNTIMVIPTLPLLVILAASIRVMSVSLLCLIIGGLGWTAAARRIRSQVMSLRERGFIDLAKLSGLRDINIAFREVLPNIFPFLGVEFVNRIAAAIGTEVGLQMIGLGPQGFPTLGLIVYWAFTRGAIIKGMWWWLVPPIVCLAAIFIGLHLINIGLDAVFNPSLQKY